MNLKSQTEIKSIFRKHIDNALDEIIEEDGLETDDIWWGENTEDRMAEVLLQVLLLLEEAEQERQANTGE